MKMWLRALLAVGLLMGLLLLSTLGLVLLVGGLGWALVTSSPALMPIGLVAIPTTFGIGYGLVALVRHRRGAAHGVVVGREEQPELWRLAVTIADKIKTRPPDEIRLVAEANAAVSEDSRWLGLVAGDRRLFVGIPLLQCLTVRELEWVLAHEMGHYSERHTALGPIAYRGLQAVSEMVTALGPRTLAGRIFGSYGRLYSSVTHSMARRQELDADRWAADLVGSAVGISALREVEVTAAAFGRFLTDYAVVAEPLAMRPADLFAGFDALCRAEGRAAEWERIRTVLPAQPSSPYDSHPPTALRIERLERPDEREPDDCVPARTILTDFDAAAASVEADLFATSGQVAVPWTVAVGQGWARRTEERAVWVMRVLDGLGSGRADLSDVLFMVAHGRGDELVEAIIGGDALPEAGSEVVHDVRVLDTRTHDPAQHGFEVHEVLVSVSPPRGSDLRGLAHNTSGGVQDNHVTHVTPPILARWRGRRGCGAHVPSSHDSREAWTSRGPEPDTSPQARSGRRQPPGRAVIGRIIRPRPWGHGGMWSSPEDCVPTKGSPMRILRSGGVAAISAIVCSVALSAPAQAQPTIQDGLVNVSVGDVTILEDVRVGVAAVVAANVCGVKVGPVAVLGRAVDLSGTSSTVCTNNTGPVTISQN